MNSEQAFQELFTSQMDAFAEHIASSVGEMYPDMDSVDIDSILEMGKERCQGINLVEATASLPKKRGKKASVPKTKAPRLLPTPESRCMARAWQDGSGFGQCAKSRTNDTDYCNAHFKKARICDTPLKVDPSAIELAHVPGKMKIGLFMGRVDQFQDGQEGIPPYKDELGIIRIEWTGDEMRSLLTGDLEAGTARYAGGEKKRKPKSKSKALSIVNVDLASELEDDNHEFTNTNLMDALASSQIESGDEGEGEGSFPIETTIDAEVKEEALANNEDIFGGCGETDDEGMEVEELEHDGITYHVEPNSCDIYNVEDGSVIGTWEMGDNGMGGYPNML